MSRSALTLQRVGRRLLQVAVTLFGLLILTFFIGRVMPIDPVLAIVGPDADHSTYQQVYQQLGFDQPLWVQFGIYLKTLLHGDLGNALLTGKPVMDDIRRVFPATLELATLAIIIGTGLGIPLGCWNDPCTCHVLLRAAYNTHVVTTRPAQHLLFPL